MENKVSYELTNPQKSIWNMEEFLKDTTINNICGSEMIYEKINSKILEQALNNVVKKNDNFRIQIEIKEGKPMQYIAEYEPFEIEVVHIKNEEDVKKIEEEGINHKFDIINSPLYHVKIYILENEFGGFVLTTHHMISDSWTMGIVAKSVVEEYHAIINGEDLPNIETSYIDYINAENEYKQSKKYDTDKKYWNEVFETIPEQAVIPGSISDHKHVSYEGKRERFKLNSDIVKKINDFCTNKRISVFNFLMAIYSIYLSRVSNLNDFVIGTPILNRTNYKEKQTMGMFVNTIPVRINMQSEDTFTEFAQNIGKKLIGVLKHQKYSYSQILADLRENNANIPNLYNVLISYQITKAHSKEAGDYKTDWIFNGYCLDDLDIHITDLNDTGELYVNYDYMIDKYTENDILNLHERIISMINQILEEGNEVIKDIEIVTKEEKEKILNEFNNTKTDYPKDKTIIDLFEEQVRKTPDNIAVVFEDKKLTYGELNEKANSLGNYLRERGINRDTLVGVMFNRSIEMIIAILAVLKAGGAYIPIDPTYPKERVEYMLSNSHAKILLTQKHLESKIEFKNIITIDSNNELVYSLSKDNLTKVNTPEDLIYVIFTSGSTGLPKGVMLTHKNIVNFVYGMMKEIKLSKEDVVVSITTISFDIFVLESFLPLINGLKIIIANEDEQTNVDLFNKLCIKNNVNIIQTTPSRMQIFISNKDHLEFIKNAKHILIGGEPFPKVLLDKFKEITHANIYNMYGPTETAVWSSMKLLKKTSEITIGTPINNTQIYLLDNNLNIVPIGVVGEIYISGDGVSRGYYNNKELTNKSFIKNPFTNTIMYKTGDLGIYNENGEIICLGRSDNQVKIRGLRIELGEIEEKISDFSGINACVVLKKKADFNHEFLCAYYVANREINISDLRKFLEKYLPKYMMPQYFMQIESLPYTPNGKIDRKNLPELKLDNIKSKSIPARNEVDEKIIEILKKELKIEQIGITDSFFDLGGDSLLAINLCVKIQSVMNTEISVRDILENPIIKDISDIVSKKMNNIEHHKIANVDKAEYYKTSSAQKRMYFASQVAGNNSYLYNMPGGVILDGKLDNKKLEECILALIHRHESLRTYFDMVDDNVVQKIEEEIVYKLNVIRDEDFDKINDIYKQFVKPFDLNNAPLFRAEYVEFTNGKSAIFIDMHHIISDGTSIDIFINELCKLYNGEKLDIHKITYKDYATYEQEQLNSGKLDEAEKYWLEKFKDEIPVLDMPSSFTRPAIQSFEGNKIYSQLDKEVLKKIDKMSKKLGITPYMILISAYYIILSKYTAQDDIVVGTPIIGRDIEEMYNTIGMFVNTLALRQRIDKNKTFKQFVLEVKENLLDSYKYQTYPFDELINKLDIKRDPSRNPLFDTMFIYQNNGFDNVNFNNLDYEYYIPDVHIAKFDLSLEAIPSKDGIKLSFEYCKKIFSEEFIKDLSNHYINILKTVLSDERIKISQINMLSEEENYKILNIFNNNSIIKFTDKKNIIEIFKEQVFKKPNNIAVQFEGKTITYKELDEKSNALAAYLQSKGLTNEDNVSILLNRSLELIIAIFAVIKTGAPYVVIDTAFPEERINYIINDSNSKYCIANGESNKISELSKIINIDTIDLSKNIKDVKILEHKENFCMIYTSGSTGKPKGVLLHEKGLINLIYAFDKEVETANHKKILGIATVSFDMFAFEMFSAILFGNTLVFANAEEQKNIIAMSKLIKENEVQFMITTPSRVELLMLEESGEPLKSIKTILLGGENLTSSSVLKIRKVTDAKIYNTYGPTEITAGCTIKLIESEKITVGKPIANDQIYICDADMNLQPIGVSGEICVAGIGVSNGYLNKKAITEKSFIKNPFGEGKIYRTGDLGKYKEDGEIEYIGRSDFQVKIRGLRIELEEIETLMLKYPCIMKAIVVKQEVMNREFLSAYFVASKRISISELRKYLGKKLPTYMVPSYFTALDDFPYTTSGKVDRKALPLPKEILNVTHENYVAPKTDLQKKLVNIWEKVLNTKPIGINDNFFELGGDSILAMNLNIELIKISNTIKYSDIFRFPTIIEQEEKINTKDSSLLFSKIENLSDNYVYILNNVKNKEKITTWHPKGILLTGSTGFLGIHVLSEFLENEQGKVYCIVRDEPGLTANAKLHQKLKYYFGNKYDDLLDTRIVAVTGNITKPGFGLDQEKLLELANSVDVVINCAARVLHYGNYDDFYNANVKSVKYIIDFCNSFEKKLYHISTTGIAGDSIDLSYLSNENDNQRQILFDESSLYVGQILDNVYTRSKFEAESYVLNAISKGLDGYILRMGNLMPRVSDGLFQENILDNAFINKFATFVKIGIIPDYMIRDLLEFTPVDSAAKAIFQLITHPTYRNRIFHLNNNKNVSVGRYIRIIKRANFEVKVLNENEFKKMIKKILEDEKSKELLNNVINDFDRNWHIEYKKDILLNSDFTVKYLRRVHFKWPRISRQYLIRFTNILRKVI